MKTFMLVFIFCLISLASFAGNPYRADLLAKISGTEKLSVTNIESHGTVGTTAFIPRYETPKGAIFCRMEDKVTRATKVWLKLGVQ